MQFSAHDFGIARPMVTLLLARRRHREDASHHPTNRSSPSSAARRYTRPSGMAPLLAEHPAYEIGVFFAPSFLHHVRTVKIRRCADRCRASAHSLLDAPRTKP